MYISIIALAILLLIPSSVFASDDFSSVQQTQRPPTNPDFDPGQSCLFDVEQIQCVPGSEQECPEGFGSNEDARCFPMNGPNNPWECPKDYLLIYSSID